MKTFTCLNCHDRHVGCHAECEKYKEARAALDDRNKVYRKDKDKRDLALTYTIEDVRRKKKERTKKG